MTDDRKLPINQYGKTLQEVNGLYSLYGGEDLHIRGEGPEISCALFGISIKRWREQINDGYRLPQIPSPHVYNIRDSSSYTEAIHQAAHAKFSDTPALLRAMLDRPKAAEVFITLEDARVAKLMGKHLDMDLSSSMAQKAAQHYWSDDDIPDLLVQSIGQSVVDIAYNLDRKMPTNPLNSLKRFKRKFKKKIQQVVESGSELDASILALKIADYEKWDQKPPPQPKFKEQPIPPKGIAAGPKPPPSKVPSMDKPTYKESAQLQRSIQIVKSTVAAGEATKEAAKLKREMVITHYMVFKNDKGAKKYGTEKKHQTHYIHALNTVPFTGRYGASLFAETFGAKDKEITQLDVTGVVTEDAWRLNIVDMEVFNPEIKDTPPINIMVDLSGSMGEVCRRHEVRQYTSSNGQLSWDVVQILQDNFPEAKTFGFTSADKHYIMEYNNGQQPQCICTEFGDGESVTPRAPEVPEKNRGMYGANNADCTALMFLAGQAQFMPGSISIMISDGQPAGGDTDCQLTVHTHDLAYTMARDGGMKFGHVFVDVEEGKHSSGLYLAESEVTLNKITDIYKVKELVDWIKRGGD